MQPALQDSPECSAYFEWSPGSPVSEASEGGRVGRHDFAQASLETAEQC